jgi:hypothetical protein
MFPCFFFLLLLLLFLFFVGPEFELRASHFKSTWAILPIYFGDMILQTICLGWPGTVILPTSVPQSEPLALSIFFLWHYWGLNLWFPRQVVLYRLSHISSPNFFFNFTLFLGRKIQVCKGNMSLVSPEFLFCAVALQSRPNFWQPCFWQEKAESEELVTSTLLWTDLLCVSLVHLLKKI